MSDGQQYARGTARPPVFQKWWLRTCTPVLRRDEQGRLYGLELYVPWWAWPFELLHRLAFGNPELSTEGVSDAE